MSTTRNIIEGIKNVTSEVAPKSNPIFTGNGITIPVLSSDPSGAVPGQMYYNSTDKGIKNYNGTAWDLMTNKFSAIGGTVTEVNGYKYHTFTSSGTFTALTSGTVEYLIVAGGGSGGGFSYGGGYECGGGGAGGYVSTSTNTGAGEYSIIVGAGGVNGTNGVNSTALGLTAVGGGAGGGNPVTGTNKGASGGSGGGNNYSLPTEGGGAGTSGQGYAGGRGYSVSFGDSSNRGGGGGGASEQGNTDSVQHGGDGLTWFDGVTRAGGGGGGNPEATGGGSGGAGGGGDGDSTGHTIHTKNHGTGNTGGGGGGAYTEGGGNYGGNGGSGIVIIRYPL